MILRFSSKIWRKLNPIRPMLGCEGMSFFSVLMIVLVLSAALTTGFLSTIPAMRVGEAALTLQRLESLRNAILQYRSHNGAVPASLDHLVSPTGPSCSVDTNSSSVTYRQLGGWCGPYIDQTVQQDPTEFKRDGWGTMIQYVPTLLTSCGSDRMCGNGDDVALGI